MKDIIEKLKGIKAELLLEYRNSESQMKQYYCKCALKYVNNAIARLELWGE